MSNRKPFIVSEESNPTANKAFSFFCRHLVSLSGVYQPVDRSGATVGSPRFFSYSGFVLSVRGVLTLVTAGHILKDLDQHLEEGSILLGSCFLLDHFGDTVVSSTPIPFDYQSSTRYYIDNDADGLDFGLVVLREHYERLLQANGIVAVSEANWIYQPGIEFDVHFMLGLPTEFITSHIHVVGSDVQIDASFSPTMIWVTELDNPPDDLPKSTYPRFVGKLSDNFPLDEIDGMSGGPVFGFKKGTRDRYWIVAIQSSWLRHRGLVFACPVPVFAGLVEQLLQSYEASSPDLNT